MRDYIPALARSCWRAGDRSGADPDSRLGKNSTNKIWRYTTIGAGEPVDRLQVSHCHPPQTLIYGGLQSLRINYIAVNIEPRRPADWSWHFCRLTLHNTAPRSILLNVISSLFWFLFLRTLRHGAGNSSRTLQRQYVNEMSAPWFHNISSSLNRCKSKLLWRTCWILWFTWLEIERNWNIDRVRVSERERGLRRESCKSWWLFCLWLSHATLTELLRIFMIHRNITFIAKNNSSNNHIKRSSENFEINNKAIKTTNA